MVVEEFEAISSSSAFDENLCFFSFFFFFFILFSLLLTFNSFVDCAFFISSSFKTKIKLIFTEFVIPDVHAEYDLI